MSEQLPGWLDQKVKDSEEKIKARQKAEVIQLPLWQTVERAIPNHIARSSLFAPIARGRRKFHDKEALVSRADVKIYFTGKQLDEADCDVWMQLLHIANQYPLGEPVPINRAEALRSIGRNTGNNDYLWLHESIRRLHLASIEIGYFCPKVRIGLIQVSLCLKCFEKAIMRHGIRCCWCNVSRSLLFETMFTGACLGIAF